MLYHISYQSISFFDVFQSCRHQYILPLNPLLCLSLTRVQYLFPHFFFRGLVRKARFTYPEMDKSEVSTQFLNCLVVNGIEPDYLGSNPDSATPVWPYRSYLTSLCLSFLLECLSGLKALLYRTSLAVQWLRSRASIAGCTGSISGWGPRILYVVHRVSPRKSILVYKVCRSVTGTYQMIHIYIKAMLLLLLSEHTEDFCWQRSV